ncbi:MAG: hypothetical protein M0Q51_15010 [Bacteroidales bacterium]|nr:hypothetical protein [Bacteroidales bacterium]
MLRGNPGAALAEPYQVVLTESTASSVLSSPWISSYWNGYVPEGLKEPIMIHVLDVDEDYLKVMGIPLKALMQESAIPGKPYSGFLYWPFSLPV